MAMHFLHKTTTYLRSPRADLVLDVVLRAVHGYREAHRASFREAIPYVLAAPAVAVKKLSTAAPRLPDPTSYHWQLAPFPTLDELE